MTDYTDRLHALMRQYLGDCILEALGNDDIEEVYLNCDMVVRYVSHSKGRQATSVRLRPADVESFLRAVATQTGNSISAERPALAAALPRVFGKCRIQGFVPPITEGPALIIRKPPNRLIALEEYVAQGALTPKGHARIRQLVAERRNIIVAGPTASGKTTLCNAILAEITAQFPQERMVILEDTPELFVTGKDFLRLYTTETTTMRHLVKYSLRSTPNRLIIGEVRDGAAKDMLDAWITGHPGGCGTVHGENCQRAFERLARLASEGANGTNQQTMVLRAVHAVVHISGYGRARKVSAIAHPLKVESDTFILDYYDL